MDFDVAAIDEAVRGLVLDQVYLYFARMTNGAGTLGAADESLLA